MEMISLDWKERIKADTLDFFERKLPEKDFDIDIIYNAYPERVDNKVPQSVITLVGKIIAAKMAKCAEDYFEFYDYILQKKGDNGKIIFAYIMGRAVRKKPDKFLDYLQKILLEIDDQRECNLIIDKAIFPLLKKKPHQYLDLMMNWIKQDNKYLSFSIQKLLVKLISFEPDMIKPIFHKLETSWLYASPNMIKLNSNFLKSTYKIDPDFYFSVFENYHLTRNPVFAEILCGAICCYNKNIEKLLTLWAASGNIKLKKVGLHGLKIHKKKGN